MLSKKPISELTNPEDIIASFRVLLNNAKDNSRQFLRQSNRNRAFLNDTQYLMPELDDFTYRPPIPSSAWMPRLEGVELRQVIDELTPLLVRSKPDVKVVPENPHHPIDLRVENAEGILEGGYSDLESSKVAQAMTEALEGEHQRNGRSILDHQIVQESMIDGRSVVGFTKVDNERGVDVYPCLLQPNQFYMDPQCQRWWDFKDCMYTIRCQTLNADQILRHLGVQESEYGGKSETEWIPTYNSLIGYVSEYVNTRTGEKKYEMPEYEVYTLYYRPDVGYGGVDGEEVEVPPMKKMTFIGDNYYVADRTVDNPWWHKDFPYIIFQSAPNPYSQWGISDVTKNMGIQMGINLMRNNQLGNTMLAANPPWVIEDEVQLGDWDMGPGGQNRVMRGGIDRMKMVDVPGIAENSVLWDKLYQLLRENQKDASGMLTGSQPGNIRSARQQAVAISSVYSQNGLRALMLDPSWHRMARMEVSNLQEHIRPNVDYYFINKEATEFIGLDNLREAMRNLQYDVLINSKDGMPHDPMERLQLLLLLRQEGIYPTGEVVKQANLTPSPETQEKIEAADENWEPNVPPIVQAQAEMQAEGIVDNLLA